jgi:hypothetical protein
MAQVNLVGNALTGSTGSGTFVGATSPTLVTPTIGAATATTVAYNSGPATSTVSGEIFTGTAGENLIFGDIVYIKSDGKLWKGNAATATLFPAQFMSTATISANATGIFLRDGFATLSSWTWTVGAPLYLATSAGTMTQTAPSATDQCIQVLGFALSATVISFRPSPDYITHT